MDASVRLKSSEDTSGVGDHIFCLNTVIAVPGQEVSCGSKEEST